MVEQTWRGGQRSVRVILADPFTVFRLGVGAILDEAGEFEVAEATSLEELEELLAAGPPPDLALVDLDLPPAGAMDAVALLCQNGAVPIVWAKRSRLSPELVFQLVQAGAVGVLTKEISTAGLLRALRGAIKGQAALGRETARLLISGAQSSSAASGTAQRVTTLSAREIEVLELVADGWPNKEIAAHLGLSEFTVKRHIQNILRKIGVRSRWEASASYLAHRRDTPAPMSFVLTGMSVDPDE